MNHQSISPVLRLAAVLLSAVLLLSGCGGSDEADTAGEGPATPTDTATADGAAAEDASTETADAGSGEVDEAALLDPAICEVMVGQTIEGIGTLSPQANVAENAGGTPGESVFCTYDGTGPDADFANIQMGTASFEPDAAAIQSRIDDGFDTEVPDFGQVAAIDDEATIKSRITDNITLTVRAAQTAEGAPVGVPAVSEAVGRAFLEAVGL